MDTIDLHYTHNPREAEEKLELELFRLYNEGAHDARVIYGIGTGILATHVLNILEKHPLVSNVEKEDTGGSCIITL